MDRLWRREGRDLFWVARVLVPMICLGMGTPPCWASTVTEDGEGSEHPPSIHQLAPMPDEAPPGPTVGDILISTGKVLLRPVMPEWKDLWILGPTAGGTALALAFDVPIHRSIRAWPDPVVSEHRFSHWGSYLGEGWVDASIFVSLGLVGDAHGRQVARQGLEALVAVAAWSQIGKRTFRVERPQADPDRKHWFGRFGADAFPGGHTMTAFATAAVLARNYPRLAPLFYGLASYVAIARVQQSTHWLSDDILGAGLGLILGFAAVEIDQRLVETSLQRVIQALRPEAIPESPPTELSAGSAQR